MVGFRAARSSSGWVAPALVLIALPGCFDPVPDKPIEPPLPACPEVEQRLETILQKYEQARLAVRGVRYRFKRTEFDAVFDARTAIHGEIVVGNPDLFRLEIRNGQGQLEDLWAWTGNALYRASFPNNKTGVWEVACPRETENAKQRNRWLEECRIWLPAGCIGLPVDEAKSFFHIRLEKEDAQWVYLTLTPRTRNGLASYNRVSAVLDRNTFRVKQVWFENPLGSEVTWDVEAASKEKEGITAESLLQDFPKTIQRIPFP